MLVTRVLVTVAATFLIVGPARGQSRTDDGAAIASKVDAIFKAFDTSSSPGCAVAAYQDDRIAYTRAFGMANLDHDVRLTPASIFHVASVSKQFTAAAILLLAQDGKLSLDDEVRTYVPELPDFGQKITIRQLAHHTSGIRDQWALLGLAGWRYSRDLITDDDVLEMLARQKDLNFAPGERHLYSNSGYTLLAIVVSRVSGQSFREFTTARIFKPLGMVNTHFRDNFSEIVKNQAYGYAAERGTFRLSVTNFDTAGATSLLTTVEDLARWHANFDSGTVGGERLLAALLERGVLNSGEKIPYAFGITHGSYRGLTTIGHGGSDAGYRSVFLRFPAHRFGVATLCNVAGANPTELSRRVADVFLADKLAPNPTASTVDEAPEVPIDSKELSQYTGLFWNQPQWSARRIVLEEGTLHAIAGPQRFRMKPIGDGQFEMNSPAGRLRVIFEGNDRGAAQRLRTSSDATVFERVEAFVPTPAQLAEFAGVYRSDEMDAVFRIALKDGTLRLERSRLKPAVLEPVITDTFVGSAGAIRFARDPTGRVTGFTLEAGRVVGVKFWKDVSASARLSNEHFVGR
jgi:CubicO group peptidase (beta-lactamase class C family)